MVNDSKQNLNQEYYRKLIVERPSEMIIRETSKRGDIPSVTNILNTTMSEKSKAALENWKKSMIEKLGEDGFNKYSRGNICVLKKQLNFFMVKKYNIIWYLLYPLKYYTSELMIFLLCSRTKRKTFYWWLIYNLKNAFKIK